MTPTRPVAAIGAVGSLGLTIYQGRHNAHFFLTILFLLWVASPFVALLWKSGASHPWVAVVIAAVSLAIYGVVALGPPRPQPAFWFLIVPLGAWVILALASLVEAKTTPSGP